MKTRWLAALLPGALAFTAVALDATFAEKEITTYPFAASAARATVIRENYPRVAAGMSPADVTAVLGEPDEVRPLYGPTVKAGKKIGYTYWYVIRRAVRHGSVNERQEALVRVSFGLDTRVIAVDHWGIDNAH